MSLEINFQCLSKALKLASISRRNLFRSEIDASDRWQFSVSNAGAATLHDCRTAQNLSVTLMADICDSLMQSLLKIRAVRVASTPGDCVSRCLPMRR